MIEEGKVRSLSAGQMKALRRFIWFLMIVVVIGGIAALDNLYERYNPELPYAAAQKQARDPMSVVRHVRLGGQPLDIPVPYFKSVAPPDGERGAVLLVTMYPDFLPLTRRPNDYWRDGEWYRNVLILAQNQHGIKSVDELFISHKRFTKATDKIEMVYGLEHHLSSEPGWGDLYAIREEGKLIGIIDCSASSHPQCTYYTHQYHLSLNISFDKKLLPHWKEIDSNSLELIRSFSPNLKN